MTTHSNNGRHTGFMTMVHAVVRWFMFSPSIRRNSRIQDVHAAANGVSAEATRITQTANEIAGTEDPITTLSKRMQNVRQHRRTRQ